MQENTNEELQLRIRDLEKEVARLHAQIKKQRYGLVWLDVPEGFESETENKIPILEEVKDKAIKNDDGKPTHILIEGDNYHALTCLNYTHKGKIDVIYIDPPYNTGSDGFTYKDKRILKEFPDGTPVPKDHPMRHSYWLSFMSKRLELAKNLLSDKGVIFISIDDNEQANLKLLCDKVFDEKNFIGLLPRITKSSGKTTDKIALNHDYLMCFAKSAQKTEIVGLPHDDNGFKHKDEFYESRGLYKLNQALDYDSLQYSPSLDYPIEIEGEILYPGGSFENYKERKNGNHKRADWEWRWSQKKYEFGLSNGFIVLKRTKNGLRIYTKTYQFANIEDTIGGYKLVYQDRTKPIQSIELIQSHFSNDNAKKELSLVFKESPFDYPKPMSIVDLLLRIIPSASTILDFFAGSGTTMHAVMKLNEEDGGKRQCILVQQKENEQNICESVTYERNRRVIQGYTNSKNEIVEGLGNSLKYYKTGFVGKNNSNNATDSDKVELSLKAGHLLALAENTLEEVSRNDFYQIFEDGKGRITAVYFKGSMMKFGEFSREIESWLSAERKNTANVYIFCWGDVSIYENEFEDMSRISLKAIPKPILDIYKSINC